MRACRPERRSVGVPLALLLALSGCTVAVPDPSGGILAKCYLGATLSFCRVENTDHKAIVTGSGFFPTFNGAAPVATEGAALAK
jgi:hypothetical protein